MDIEQFQNSVLGLTIEGTLNSAWELYKQSQHALWMARAMRALTEAAYYVRCGISFEQSDMKYSYSILAKKWSWVQHKCLQKAKEFE